MNPGTNDAPIRVGVVGTGFISGLFVRAAARTPDLRVTRVLTRRHPADRHGVPAPELLTADAGELLDHCDVVLECSGDAWHAAEVIEAALQRGLPVATLNAQFHVTVGSHFVGRGLVSECAGDQPGSLAALKAQVVGMGFEPLAYASMKGFLDPDPTPDNMRYWAEKQGISLPMVTSFTDGTKLDIEQVLVANGCGAIIPPEGMLGPRVDTVDEAAAVFAAEAEARGEPLSDYVLSRALPHGIFVAARHHPDQADALRYLKCGDGPVYTVVRPAIYAHLEAMNSIRALVREGSVLLDNTASPRFGVGAVAKRDLAPGDPLPYGVGSFDLRGRVVRMAENPGHMPIGLIRDAVVRRPLKRGDLVMFDDLELPDGLAVRAWEGIASRAAAGARVPALPA